MEFSPEVQCITLPTWDNCFAWFLIPLNWHWWLSQTASDWLMLASLASDWTECSNPLLVSVTEWCCQYPLNAWRPGQARIELSWELRVGKSNLFLAIKCNVSASGIKSILYFLSDLVMAYGSWNNLPSTRCYRQQNTDILNVHTYFIQHTNNPT